jgi:hypothetical protein
VPGWKHTEIDTRVSDTRPAQTHIHNAHTCTAARFPESPLGVGCAPLPPLRFVRHAAHVHIHTRTAWQVVSPGRAASRPGARWPTRPPCTQSPQSRSRRRGRRRPTRAPSPGGRERVGEAGRHARVRRRAGIHTCPPQRWGRGRAADRQLQLHALPSSHSRSHNHYNLDCA